MGLQTTHTERCAENGDLNWITSSIRDILDDVLPDVYVPGGVADCPAYLAERRRLMAQKIKGYFMGL